MSGEGIVLGPLVLALAALAVWQRHRLWLRRATVLGLLFLVWGLCLLGFGHVGRIAADSNAQTQVRNKIADDYMAGQHAARGCRRQEASSWGCRVVC